MWRVRALFIGVRHFAYFSSSGMSSLGNGLRHELLLPILKHCTPPTLLRFENANPVSIAPSIILYPNFGRPISRILQCRRQVDSNLTRSMAFFWWEFVSKKYGNPYASNVTPLQLSNETSISHLNVGAKNFLWVTFVLIPCHELG